MLDRNEVMLGENGDSCTTLRIWYRPELANVTSNHQAGPLHTHLHPHQEEGSCDMD
jgi:hypothetical protein